MASTFTTNTGIEKIGDGEQTGQWGQTTNLNFDIVDRALNGVLPIQLSSTAFTLTTSSGGLSDGQAAAVVFSGSIGGPATITIAPDTAQKTYVIRNDSNQPITITQGSGGDVTIPVGSATVVACTGVGATSRVFEAGISEIDLATGVTGTLAIANGGTGNGNGNAATATALQTARTINGVSFDGTANIALPATGNAATATALQTARTINGVSFDGTANITLPTVNTSGDQTIAGIKTFSTAVAVTGTSKAAGQLYAGSTNPSNTTRLNYDGNLHVNALTAVGDVTAFSDARLKTDLVVISDALGKVHRLTGYTYTRLDSGARHTGLIAQDVQAILPEAVTDNGEMLSLAYGNMIGLLVEAVKEMTARLEKLELR